MVYMGDKDYWNKKFKNRKDSLLHPEKSLVDNVKYFKAGTVLDIGCGDGRNTLFLFEKGFKVTGIDFSEEALKRLNIFSRRKCYSVDTKKIDLNAPDSLDEFGVFDNIVINHYKLSKDKIPRLSNHIVSGGILFISGFGYKDKIDSNFEEEDLILKKDLLYLDKSFKLVEYNELMDHRGFLVTYIFRRN